MILSIMKRRILYYIYPLIGVTILALLMLRPNFFNLIPQTIYYAFDVSSMEEIEFIIWFDIIFLVLIYWMLLRVIARIMNWKR